MTLSFKSYLLLNGSLLIFISFNNVFNFNLIDLTLILSILLYSIKWNESEWLVPFLLFAWGIFQDILLGMNLGYSGSIFLFFYVLSQITSINGLFEQQKIKFTIFLIALLILFIFKNLFRRSMDCIFCYSAVHNVGTCLWRYIRKYYPRRY